MPSLDLRTIAPRDRHPTIFGHLDALAPGEVLEIVNDHRPSPLRHELEATRRGQFAWEDGEDGPEVFSARIACLARVVDARPVLAEGGEPFDLIMGAVQALDVGQPLVVIAPFEPVPLEGLLSDEGFDYDAEELDGGDWRVVFRGRS